MEKNVLRGREERAEKLRSQLNANMWYVTVASVIVAVLMALFVFAH